MKENDKDHNDKDHKENSPNQLTRRTLAKGFAAVQYCPN